MNKSEQPGFLKKESENPVVPESAGEWLAYEDNFIDSIATCEAILTRLEIEVGEGRPDSEIVAELRSDISSLRDQLESIKSIFRIYTDGVNRKGEV